MSYHFIIGSSTRIAVATVSFALWVSCGVGGLGAQPGGDVEVTIRVVVAGPLPPGESLFLSGNHPRLGGWNPAGLPLQRVSDDCFETTITVARATRLLFKATRGTWSTVETSGDGKERPNRALLADQSQTVELRVDGWADQTRSTGLRRGVVGDLRVWYETSIDPARAIRVWLPPGYGKPDAAGMTNRYPVLYLLDGQNLFDSASSAIGIEWQVDETLTREISGGALPAMIVVGIDNSSKRFEEYTAVAFEFGDQPRGGESSGFINWMSDVLKAHIDHRFDTLPGRESTWIGGSSLGGLCAMQAVLSRDDVFSRGLVLSPSVFWGGPRLTEETLTQLARVTHPVRLWFDFGDAEGATAEVAKANLRRYLDFQKDVLAVTEAGVSDRIQATFEINPGGTHSERTWRDRFPVGLKEIVKARSQ